MEYSELKKRHFGTNDTDKKLTDEEIISSLEVIATTRNCNECKIRNCKWGTCNCSQITAGILRDDKRIPASDVIEVVRCKNCKYFQDKYVKLPDGSKRPYEKGEDIVPLSVGINVGSYCTRIDYAIVHGYRNGEPSVDKTRLWTNPDDFCSCGERKDEE